MLRSSWIRWLAGFAAFALPAFVVVVGIRLDQSSIRNDPAYAALIPVVFYGSIFVAGVVPAALIMTSARSMSRRIGLTAAVWCLLAIECVISVFIVLATGH